MLRLITQGLMNPDLTWMPAERIVCTVCDLVMIASEAEC